MEVVDCLSRVYIVLELFTTERMARELQIHFFLGPLLSDLGIQEPLTWIEGDVDSSNLEFYD